ncbi:hypothetical protein CUJ89_02090 [Burkholderia pyrrocinia]|uniref:Helix-turn-helix domain-containing protein n=1 Tax=Burkholderia pyrrocinia TaxID=60550 RepID=A0A2Z5MQI5_BURPY|nr:hypothetical protein [Burkholderia pyrrocinia]AXF19419.1 hypothetical protein CUJ89_02090 [Burkholderia pyrrocinia]
MDMTIAELAKRLFVSRSYVRKLLDEGKLPTTPGPDGEAVVEWDVAEQYIAAAKVRQRQALEEYLRVSAEQHEIEQLRPQFDEYMRVARRATVENVVRVRCAYEALYEVARFAVNTDGVGIAAMDAPDAHARAVVERAAQVLQLTPEETCQVLALNAWGLSGVPADPPLSADVAVQLAERMLAACLVSRGRG